MSKCNEGLNMPKVGGQACREVQPDAVPHLGVEK